MVGFQFRLQNLLMLREKMEEQKKEEYGKILQELELAIDKKEQLLIQIERTYEEFKKIINRRLSPKEINSYNHYIDELNKNYQLQQKSITQKQQLAEEKRIALLEAMKDRKMLESLKEKDYIQYQEEEKKNEQKSIDELVSFQYKNHQ